MLFLRMLCTAALCTASVQAVTPIISSLHDHHRENNPRVAALPLFKQWLVDNGVAMSGWDIRPLNDHDDFRFVATHFMTGNDTVFEIPEVCNLLI